ncbi:hypothetical protein CTTA_5161 [Comamonas testosteroni]|uniref:Uncharacterized protein n=1 Tax=Comamonas testosteroni TaxID=285 RepID=A0A5A7MK89_COMTE|nr:hypothetical protein CTTA_5161 [Comamonas testosteroni]
MAIYLRIQAVDATRERLRGQRGAHMKQTWRNYYTESQKALMWESWRKGDPLRTSDSMLAVSGADIWGANHV